MTQDVATLKAEITSALDSLPPESLRLLREFVAFLRSRGEELVPHGRIVKSGGLWAGTPEITEEDTAKARREMWGVSGNRRSDSFSKEEMDEKGLIAAAQRGQVPAFNQLVLTYQSIVYNLAYRILGDADAAADASQDAFLSAFRAIKKFRGGSFKAWLLRIATNACYDQLRYKQRRPTTSLEALLVETDQPSSFADPTEGPEDYALRQELGRVIQTGLNTLPPDQRIALALSDIQGLSYEEIAEITRASVGTVKSRLSRGRTKLRDYLLEQGELLPARYRLKGRESAVNR